MKSLLCTLTGLIFLCSIAFSQTDPNHPNILLIIADDIGIDAMNGYQQNSALMPVTPNLDTLREKGLTFRNAWSTPKCAPTRAAIMTGKYGVKTDILDTPAFLDTSHTSIFQALETQTGGVYSDAVIGKWHIASGGTFDHVSDMGVDYFEGILYGNVLDYYAWQYTNNQGVTETSNEYASDFLTDKAIDWVEAQNQPWFLWWALVSPHGPYQTPPANTYVQAPTNTNRQNYMAMIENIDYNIGRLLSSMPADVRDNTVIIFLGDNGGGESVSQNYPSGQNKGTVYEGATAVPLVMTGPGVARVNEQEQGLVHVMDIYATLLDMFGANLPGGVFNSQSFLNNLTSPNLPMRPYNYTEIKNSSEDDYAIREDQYKLLEFGDGSQEFYDLINDPLETVNLIDSLTTEQEAIRLELENEAYYIRSSWSCNDQIQNGSETSIDCGATNCFGCEPPNGFDCEIFSLETCGDVQQDTSIIAEEYVRSQHKFTSQNARIHAGNLIELKPGFEFTGGELEAEIESCDKIGIDDSQCPNDNSLSQINIGCCETPPANSSQYAETIASDIRTITCNNFPNHDYCLNNGGTLSPVNFVFNIDVTPALANEKTAIVNDINRPLFYFGVAANGVKYSPAPGQPFIFENTLTGEYNWDWMFEPTNMQGATPGIVKLDCSSAHSNAAGYHYHGNMIQYIEEVMPGMTSTTTPPAGPIFIGWAADGHPIVYRFGPDGTGGLKLLQPGYRLKYGNRPGDGVSAPCGTYTGRYTADYEHDPCVGDLDECNGIERTITLTTPQGVETFNYFYVITDDFPQISRCFSGTPDNTFRVTN